MPEHLELPPGYVLREFEEIDSTNLEAKRCATDGAPDGTVIWSRTQTGGRGRRGRRWISPPGNLYLSIVKRPAFAPAIAGRAGFCVSLAVADVVEEAISDDQPVVGKWPNDVLVAERKVAGILVETTARSPSSLEWMVIGIGINVANHPDLDGDGGAIRRATHLGAHGNAPPLHDVVQQLISAFDRRWRAWRADGFGNVRHEWLRRCWRLGETVQVVTGDDEVKGVFAGLDDRGAIILELPDGGQRVLGHGELLMAG